MTDSGNLPYAVIGATGQQGGAVVDALLARSQPVRALTRDTTSEKSMALADRGVEVVYADQDDPESMIAAFDSVAALFMMTTFAGDAGTQGEIDHGRAMADAAVAANVPRVVYSSVGGAERSSGVPHFESKRRVEEYLFEVIPTRVVRPVFFMENLSQAIEGADGEFVLQLPMPGSVPLQMVAVRDIGVVATALLLDPTVIEGDAIEIAGDALTGDQIAGVIGTQLGLPARYDEIPVDVLPDEEAKTMFRWFAETPAYQADIGRVRAVDPELWDLAAWVENRE